jgi:UDP-N-acetylmuramoyl-L-alanyl-D-glutamate--2,6-diaminopimelate ligase
VQVRHGREALATAALKFYNRPDRRVKLTGVTGTNGKTTTVFLIDSVLREAGFVTARLGTIEHRVAGKARKAVNTTPESLDLVRLFVDLEKEAGTHATIEVSSHALDLRRVFGMDFHTVVFTNFTRDHLDYHQTMDRYKAAKRLLFEGAGGTTPNFGVANVEDPVGREFLNIGGFEPISYGMGEGGGGPVQVKATQLDISFDGIRMQIATPAGPIEIHSPMHAEFNARNILAAVAAALAHGIDRETIRRGIERCGAVPGRFESVDEGQPFLVVVDYAHTDDALKNLIEAARQLTGQETRPGRIITMFGCGGDRDRTKRPVMGEIAGRLSDHVILTSDNPRSENPLNIINDIRVGIERVSKRYEMEADRARAIHKALSEAREGDIVLLAGKGHETYQTIGGESLPFDDRQVARQVLRELGYGTPLD